jgi:hydrogenase expression/formation protein HypD
MLVRQLNDGRAEVENEFTRAVTREGNAKAKALVAESSSCARRSSGAGSGEVPYSALAIKRAYREYDAEAPLRDARSIGCPTTRRASAGRSCAA